MFREFFVNIIERRAQKFVIGLIGGGITWAATHGVPLDQWVSDATVSGIGAAVTAGLVYAVRNVG